MATWEQLGELSTVAQLTGLVAARLIGLIVQAATTARMHKKNCQRFARHLKLIGNLLEQLKISELKKYPETREPLEQLEDALRRRPQAEIDRYLQIVPFITLVDNAQFRERLETVARDEREYTLNEEDRKVQDAILDGALKKEREKLQIELQRSHDIGQCEMIQHLIGVTQNVVSTSEEKCAQLKSPKKVELNYSGANSYNENTFDDDNYEKDTKPTSRGLYRHEEWHSDLLGCFSKPSLSSTEACNDLMAYSLILSCCCYTCCVRRKLRKMFNIRGGLCNDFLSHLLCCCCALVQECQEVEIRGVEGPWKTRTGPPASKYMES
ncbi:hypothetical protein OPV22_012024 [Ensete ventricosum]|uniref:MCAfunc domain-containing protein n=1 Tax=Ensete ventricosum TaxID=4639 RepID=A0AAV8R3X5_ENSVE|nr:hypothetical protein OPV22_012024 [Ensete ventricosum]